VVSGNSKWEMSVKSMLQLARETKVPEVRVVIYRQLNGIEYSVIRKPLVEALLHDVSSEVREEAARSLGPLRDDPEVQDALVQAQQNDESKRVRKQAEASLAGESTLMTLGGIATNGGWESEQ
jgi:HEAT repeat protein